MKNRFTLLIAFCLMASYVFSQTVDVVSGLNNPWSLAVYQDEIFISEDGDGKISKVDLSQPTPTPQDVITGLGLEPFGGMEIEGTTIYYSLYNQGKVQKFDVTESTPSPIDAVTGLSGFLYDILIDNDIMYVATGSSKIYKIDLTQSPPTVEEITVTTPQFSLEKIGDYLYYSGISPSGFPSGDIYRINLTETTPTSELVVNVPSAFSLTGNGNFLYVAQNNGKVSKVNLTASPPSVEELVSGLGNVRQAAFDGIDMYISRYASGIVSKLEIGQPDFSVLGTICSNAIPTGLGGASPTGGAYSGSGVTDDGNGETFTFDPTAAGGIGTYTITYTAINGQTATSTLTVVAPPTAMFTPPSSVTVDAGVQTGLGGGTPTGGIYSGPGVTDDGNGMTYSFDPMAAGIGMQTINYTFTDVNGCSDIASGDVTVNNPIPDGDECSNANDLNALFGQAENEPQTSTLWDNTNATTMNDPTTGWECFGEPDGSGSNPSLERTLWYSFMGDGNIYNIKSVECSATNYNEDNQVAIYTGDCGNLMPVACNEDENTGNALFNFSLEMTTEAGVTYYMMVDGFGGNFPSEGEFCIEVTNLGMPPAPDGNECNDANDINSLFGGPINDAQVSTLWDNTNYTSVNDPADGNSCHLNGDDLTHTIWYSFTSPDGSTYGIRTIECNATNYNADKQMTIYAGGDCGNLTQVACNEDEDEANGLFNAYIELPTDAGTTYFVVVDGFQANTGEYCLEVTNLAPNSATDIVADQIKVYPNPTSGFLQIENVDADQLQVFDSMGRLVFSQKQPGNQVDISQVPTGIYFLKIQAGEAVYSARVVKE